MELQPVANPVKEAPVVGRPGAEGEEVDFYPTGEMEETQPLGGFHSVTEQSEVQQVPRILQLEGLVEVEEWATLAVVAEDTQAVPEVPTIIITRVAGAEVHTMQDPTRITVLPRTPDTEKSSSL
jgi:hypothetical protein